MRANAKFAILQHLDTVITPVQERAHQMPEVLDAPNEVRAVGAQRGGRILCTSLSESLSTSQNFACKTSPVTLNSINTVIAHLPNIASSFVILAKSKQTVFGRLLLEILLGTSGSYPSTHSHIFCTSLFLGNFESQGAV